ncbi:hypothetical protein PJL18_00578 [Paenarthrobacter nicotinovorans]|nr:hypothetical protein [Paenarthrobacter nicotinovorans]
MHDAGQGVVLGGAGDFDFQWPGSVDGPGIDIAAGTGLHGDGFTGKGRGVQGGAAGDDSAIGGQSLTRADNHPLPGDEFGWVHGDLSAAAQDPRFSRYQVQQGPQTAPGFGQRVFLQAFGDGVEEGEHGCFLVLAQRDGTGGGDRHQGADADLALKQAPEGGGNKGPGSDQQSPDFQDQAQPLRPPRQGQDPSGQEQHTSDRSGPDLVDLPESDRFLSLFGRGFGLVVAAAAGVAHQAFSFVVFVSSAPALPAP